MGAPLRWQKEDVYGAMDTSACRTDPYTQGDRRRKLQLLHGNPRHAEDTVGPLVTSVTLGVPFLDTELMGASAALAGRGAARPNDNSNMVTKPRDRPLEHPVYVKGHRDPASRKNGGGGDTVT